MIVSHDRYFLDRLVQHIFVFEGDGKISDFPGNYTELRDYQDEQEAEKKNAASNAPKPVAPAPPTPKEPVAAAPVAVTKRKLSYKEQKEMEQLEADIAHMEARKTQLVENLNIGGSHEELAKWSKQIEEINDSQAEKEMRWLELSENA